MGDGEAQSWVIDAGTAEIAEATRAMRRKSRWVKAIRWRTWTAIGILLVIACVIGIQSPPAGLLFWFGSAFVISRWSQRAYARRVSTVVRGNLAFTDQGIGQTLENGVSFWYPWTAIIRHQRTKHTLVLSPNEGGGLVIPLRCVPIEVVEQIEAMVDRHLEPLPPASPPPPTPRASGRLTAAPLPPPPDGP